MDLTVKLPKTDRGHDSILVFVDRLSNFPLGLIEGMSLRENMASVRFWIPVLFVCKTAEVIHYDRSSWLLCL